MPDPSAFGIRVGDRVRLTHTHPWGANEGECIALEYVAPIETLCPRLRLVNSGHEILITRQEHVGKVLR